MTEEEISTLIPKTTTPRGIITTTDEVKAATTRKLLFVGTGDGGCNIASDIGGALAQSGARVIAYNTCTRAMNDVSAHLKIFPDGEDGSGKARSYSKDIFKNGVYKDIIKGIRTLSTRDGPFEYIVVCSTADGGTGSGISPVCAKLIKDNVDVPVMILGVYPATWEDAIAQFNALQWQAEVEKTGLPYFVLDNDQPETSKKIIHKQINSYAARMMSLLAGQEFGNTGISMIDDRNLFSLLAPRSGQNHRALIAISAERLRNDQSLDDYVEKMLRSCNQPMPSSIGGIGIFVRGPHDLIERIDTSLQGFQDKYGRAILHFAHIEEGDDIKVAILLTDCDEPSQRLLEMKNRYDDVMVCRSSAKSILDDFDLDMDDDPMDMGMSIVQRPTDIADKNIDISALDLL